MKQANLSKTSFGKKGTIMDVIFVAISLIAVILLIIFAYSVLIPINDNIQSSSQLTPLSKEPSQQITNNYSSWMDTVFFVLWLSFFLGAIVSAWFIDVHPVFFVFSVIISVVILVALVPISNVLESIVSDNNLISFTIQFPIISFFVSNFFKIMVVEVIAILISLYAKNKSDFG